MANLTIILNKPKTASQEAVEHLLPVGAAGSKIVTKDKQYELTLTVEKLDFKKKVYSPCELNFQINITEIVDKSDKKQVKTVALDFSHCSKIADTMTDFFVKLRCDNPSSSVYACENYYVYSVNPEFSTEGGKPTITLNVAAYSADHRLTLHKTNRAFTAKKFFSEVVVKDLGSSGALAAFNVEVNKDKCLQFIKSYKKIVTLDNTTVKEIKYEELSEIIHPYMVQYDETYYNFLARTANRCGEFMYFEDGKLNFGLDKPYYEQPQVINYDNNDDIKDRRSTITGVSLTRLSTPNQPELKAYYPSTMVFNDQKKAELTYSDTNFVEDAKVGNDEFLTTMKKGKWVSRDDIYAPEGAGGIIIPILSDAFSKQTIGEMLGDLAATTAIKYANSAMKKDEINKKLDKKIWDKYAKDDRMIKKDKESYMFTSDTSKWDSNLQKSVFKGSNFKNEMNLIFYHTLLNLEREVAKEAITISTGSDFDDEVKIGKIIQFNGKRYVVVGVYGVYNTSKDKARPVEKYSFTAVPVKEIKNLDLTLYNYQEIQNDKTSKREPKVSEKINAVTAIIPPLYEHGHVCYSSMQRAIVVNAGDPQSYGRVQIKYPWQQKEDKDDDPSPFIRVAKDCAGKGFGINFKTEDGTEVLIDYEGGNVERPFVVGMLHSFVDKPQMATRSIRSYNGHKIVFDDPSDSFKMLENIGGGAASLVTNLIQSQGGCSFKVDELRQFAGGIELSDKYGFYKIAMSTDKRQIDIASPCGKVNINAFTGINISAPNGNIKISGKNIDIQASNNLNICSGTQIYKGITGGGILKDLASTFTSKILNYVSPDIGLIRCIVEAFVKPCSGTLRIKSYRFLLLEAGQDVEAHIPFSAYTYTHKQLVKLLKSRVNFSSSPNLKALAETPEVLKKCTKDLIYAWNAYVKALSNVNNSMNGSKALMKGNNDGEKSEKIKESVKNLSKTSEILLEVDEKNDNKMFMKQIIERESKKAEKMKEAFDKLTSDEAKNPSIPGSDEDLWDQIVKVAHVNIEKPSAIDSSTRNINEIYDEIYNNKVKKILRNEIIDEINKNNEGEGNLLKKAPVEYEQKKSLLDGLKDVFFKKTELGSWIEDGLQRSWGTNAAAQGQILFADGKTNGDTIALEKIPQGNNERLGENNVQSLMVKKVDNLLPEDNEGIIEKKEINIE
ncbi:MAG: hypothetical protein HUK14_04245 [Muribaculaceae bacterium]|nr:hypothetical protein [Muribaculaceae bacterium]